MGESLHGGCSPRHHIRCDRCLPWTWVRNGRFFECSLPSSAAGETDPKPPLPEAIHAHRGAKWFDWSSGMPHKTSMKLRVNALGTKRHQAPDSRLFEIADAQQGFFTAREAR